MDADGILGNGGQHQVKRNGVTSGTVSSNGKTVDLGKVSWIIFGMMEWWKMNIQNLFLVRCEQGNRGWPAAYWLFRSSLVDSIPIFWNHHGTISIFMGMSNLNILNRLKTVELPLEELVFLAGGFTSGPDLGIVKISAWYSWMVSSWTWPAQ